MCRWIRFPTFMTMRLDQALLRPAAAPLAGKGTVQYRRALAPSVFLGPWATSITSLLAPGSATAPQAHPEIGEFYYVINGEGSVTVGSGDRADSSRATRCPFS